MNVTMPRDLGIFKSKKREAVQPLAVSCYKVHQIPLSANKPVKSDRHKAAAVYL